VACCVGMILQIQESCCGLLSRNDLRNVGVACCVGTIPDEWMVLQTVVNLDLSWNGLGGIVPSALFAEGNDSMGAPADMRSCAC
jgi:hypothetical protein